MEVTPIHALKPYEQDKKIRVRICRIWKTKSFVTDGQFSSFNSILVDARGDAVQATVESMNFDFFEANLEPGGLYDITNFHTVKNKGLNRVVPHVAMVQFSKTTVLKRLQTVQPAIPRHRFYLLEYSQLPSRIDQPSLLTGRLIAIQPLEEKLVQKTRLESKREFMIENMRREKVRVTLWSDAAKSFDEQALELLAPPVFIAFTSLKVKEYQRKPVLSSTNATLYFLNPEIPELQSYTIAFHALTAPIEVLPSSGTDQLKHLEKKSLSELRVLNPETHKDTTFACRATVTDFDLRWGWWYKSCPSYAKQLRPSSDSVGLMCPNHKKIDKAPLPWFKLGVILEDQTAAVTVLMIGKPAENFFGVSCNDLVLNEGFEDQHTLPDKMLRMKGKTKIFHLRFGTFKTDSNKTDLLVSKVFDEELPLLQENPAPAESQLIVEAKDVVPQTMLPTTPTLLPKITTATPISASPAPVKAKSSSASKQRAGVKRALFTSIIQTRERLKSATSKKKPDMAIVSKVNPKEAITKKMPLQTTETHASDSDNLPLTALKSVAVTKKAKKSATTEKKADMATSEFDDLPLTALKSIPATKKPKESVAHKESKQPRESSPS